MRLPNDLVACQDQHQLEVWELLLHFFEDFFDNGEFLKDFDSLSVIVVK